MIGSNKSDGNQWKHVGRFIHKNNLDLPVLYFILQNLNFYFKQFIFVYSKSLSLEHDINWIGNGVPPDEPLCGFDGEYCVHKTDWSLIIFGGISSFIILTAAIFAFRSVILVKIQFSYWNLKNYVVHLGIIDMNKN